MVMRFEWDQAAANLESHGVSFAEATTVLEDDFALTREDPVASGEARFVTLGLVRKVSMKEVVAEEYRDIDFSDAKRGAVVKPEPGKTKISIRLDNAVIEYFRDLVDRAGGGNYQTLINEALFEYIHKRSTVDVVRQVVREELASFGAVAGAARR